MTSLTKLEDSTTVKQPVGKHLPPVQTPAGKTAYDAIMEVKRAAGRRSQKRERIFGAMCLLAFPPLCYVYGPTWTSMLLFGIFPLLHASGAPGALTEDEYYSIPGARAGKRGHTCIYCGSHDKEVHQFPRSGVEVTYCADCDARLF
jgi:hypothetical protein